jgi:single-stranded-DNA-specific exonuclease
MQESIKRTVEKFIELSNKKEVYVVSHFDTDGITSAAIITKTLQRLNINFQLKIVKGLEESVFKELPQDKVILFVDLASNSFNYIKELNTEVFILDHHEITSEIPENVTIVNPHLFKDKEELSSAALCYLFAKEIDENNSDLAYLAIVGMVGDMLEKNLGKTYTNIIKESNIQIKKGLLLYPATRPIDRVLEYSSNIVIPGVTGSNKGTNEFLREIGMDRENGKHKTILELNQDELSKLITSITLQRSDLGTTEELVGNIYLVNFFNKLEDCREISAMINACSRNGESGTAVAFCLQNKKAKTRVEKLHTQNKQNIVKALNVIPNLIKIENKNYLIINAQDKIKDTIIGTIASILSNSREYEQGKAIIGMAYNEDKIKISARMVGKSGKNVREILNSVIEIIGGEVGGHQMAAGCLIEKGQEEIFIEEIKKQLEVERVKIN